MDKKKGFTLIECTLYIGLIISCLCIFIFMMSINYKKIYNKLEVIRINNSILSLFNDGRKEYLVYKEPNHIEIDREKGEIKYYKGLGNIKRKIKLPRGFYFDSSSLNGIIVMNENGSNKSFSLSYKDWFKKSHKITISVGSGDVDIKDDY